VGNQSKCNTVVPQICGGGGGAGSFVVSRLAADRARHFLVFELGMLLSKQGYFEFEIS